MVEVATQEQEISISEWLATRHLNRLGVGAIPDGWSLSSVGDACAIRNELRLPISVEERAQIGGPFPYYGPTGILDYINEFRAVGDFALIGEDGDHFLDPSGKPQTVRARGRFNVNNHAHLIAGTDRCDVDWFAYFFRHRDIFHSLTRQGTNRFKLTKASLEKLPILLPPLPEQRRVAEILRSWDEAIEKLEALRTANIKRRVWFRTHVFAGKVRPSGFSGEWKTLPLSKVLHEHGSRSTGAEEVFSVSLHKGLVNQVEHLGRSFSAANTDHYNRVLPGDIVYTKSPTGDFPLGIIKQSKIDQEVIVSPLYGVFTPQTFALGVILDALFESPVAAQNYLRPLVQKGAKNTIAVTNSQFLEGKLHLPLDPIEQSAIADIVNASNAELDTIDREITALQRQKRGLMQKLLTGEWRVSVEEISETAS